MDGIYPPHEKQKQNIRDIFFISYSPLLTMDCLSAKRESQNEIYTTTDRT
jgi:hypothetical protein